MLSTPFRNISERIEKKRTLSIGFLFFITSFVMLLLNKPLINSIAPNGILSFELANTLEHSQEITASRPPFDKIFAGIGLDFDFLYTLIYPLFIAIIIHKINTHLWSTHLFYKIGELLIWSLLVAAIVDVVENVCSIQTLTRNTKQYWVRIGYYAAVTKFLLILLSSLYIVLNFILLLIKKRS